MRLLMIVLVSCAALVSTVQGGKHKTHRHKVARQATASTPMVDQILEKYMNALGGKAALQKVNSRSSKGVILIYTDLFPICAPVSINELRPNRKVTVVESACVLPIFRWGTNDKDSWFDAILEEGPFISTKPSFDNLSLWLEDYCAFYPMINIRQSYPELILKGQKSIDGHQSYEVEGKRYVEVQGERADIIKHWYFDVKTGLLQCTTLEDMNEETCYQDYRQVDNIMVPFKIRVLNGFLGSGNFVITLNEVKDNVSIKNSIFNPPQEHKALDLPKPKSLVNPDPSRGTE